MPRINRRYPPLIQNSSVKTGIVIALVKHGALTMKELCEILQLEHSHVMKRIRSLVRARVVTTYRWAGHNHFEPGPKKPKG